MLLFAAITAFATQARPVEVSPGSLISTGPEPISLPLKSTKVSADISGFGARVSVVQNFTNSGKEPIEAIYTFPMPADAAVDHMTMTIGNRVIEGVIKRREEARLIYEAAKNQGKAAALLDQERPNIFTQSVANIMPGSDVKIEISYVQLMKYEDGEFEFNFPMVVGPRFLGNAPDPNKIAPPIVPKGRSGQNISLDININAGAPITGMKSVLHQISVNDRGQGQARVSLRRKDEIPNKDFILRYSVATNTVQSAFIGKYDPLKGGYFSLILLPPKAPAQQQIAPKEVIFVVDQSGSQSGFPIEKSKELTLKLIKTLKPGDTFNVLGFANGVNPLWTSPKANTRENQAEATNFVSKLQANGGTQLRAAVEAALTPAPDPNRIRLVVFNTDGFVGDEAQILASIRKYRGNTRMFTFGIGNGVNRYLIDSMSEEGRGDSEVVTLAEQADPAVERFIRRTENPILTNVSVKVDGIETSDMLPAALPDVFSEKPIVVFGRYTAPGAGKITVTGTMAGQPWSKTLDVTFPSDRPGAESIPTLWARRQVDHLERAYQLGSRFAENPQEGQAKIVDLALEYGIMTQYTSFVAVEQRMINVGGKQRKVLVPVEMTEGVTMAADPSRPGSFVRYAGAASMSIAGLPGPGTFTGGRGGAGGTTGGTTGGSGGPPLSEAKAIDSDGVGNYLRFDAATNDFALNDERIKKLAPEQQKKIAEARAKFLLENKVAKPLRTAKGEVEAQIWLTEVSDEALAELTKLGFKVDSKAAELKMVFGRLDTAALEKLVQSKFVKRIEPIG